MIDKAIEFALGVGFVLCALYSAYVLAVVLFG